MDEDIANFLAEEEEEADLNEDVMCSYLDPEKENDSGEPNLTDSDRNKASWSRPLVSNPISGAQHLGTFLTCPCMFSFVSVCSAFSEHWQATCFKAVQQSQV